MTKGKLARIKRLISEGGWLDVDDMRELFALAEATIKRRKEDAARQRKHRAMKDQREDYLG